MKTVSASQFREQYSRLLEEAQRTGEPIAITKRGKQLATVLPSSDQTTSSSIVSELMAEPVSKAVSRPRVVLVDY